MSDAAAASKWFGRGFVPGQYKPPVETDQGGPQDVYNRGRFFLRDGDEKTIVFLDGLEEGFRFAEHSACDLDHNRRPTFFPCLRLMGKPCWLCEQRCPVKRVIALTVIDVDGYTYTKGEKKGTHVKNVKRLFVVSERNLGLFVRKSEAVKGLRAYKFKAFRSNDKASNLGDDYTPVERVTKAWVDAEKIDTKAFEYDKIFPFTLTAEDQKTFFQENPQITWNQPSRDGDPHAAASAPAPDTSAPETGDDIPF